MPNAYILNQVPTTWGQALSLHVEMLVAAGWMYKASGDGLAGYSATGKIFTNTGSGALGWTNDRAWVRLSDPAGGREIVMQRNNTNGLRIKYSASAKFTGGSPSATTTPSATDEKYIIGGATDASPTYMTAFFQNPIGACRFQGAAMAAAPYGFWSCCISTPSGTLANSVFMMDPVTSVPEDPDPVVFYVTQYNSQSFKSGWGYGGGQTGTPGGNSIMCMCHMNAAKTAWLGVDPAGFFSGGGEGGSISSTYYAIRGSGMSPNPFNSKVDALPVLYQRQADQSTPNGVKGFSSLVRWTTVPRNTILDTMNNRQWIAIGNCWLPWDGVTDPMN